MIKNTRVMLWLLSGGYSPSSRMPNFPSIILSRIQSDPDLSPMWDTRDLLRNLTNEKSLGLWWGHSDLYNSAWETGYAELFDPANQTHIEHAWRELDPTDPSVFNFSMVGLDAFAGVKWTEQLSWLTRMQARYLHIKTWVTEGWASPDFVNSVAPGYHLLSFTQLQPNFMGDFLMPGDEWWLQDDVYSTIPSFEKYGNMSEIGYVPIILDWYQPSKVAEDYEQLRYNTSAWLRTVPPFFHRITTAPIEVGPLSVLSYSVNGTTDSGFQIAVSIVSSLPSVPLTFVWRKNDEIVSVTTSETLVVTSDAGIPAAGNWTCEISDACGCYSALSAPLHVPTPDPNKTSPSTALSDGGQLPVLAIGLGAGLGGLVVFALAWFGLRKRCQAPSGQPQHPPVAVRRLQEEETVSANKVHICMDQRGNNLSSTKTTHLPAAVSTVGGAANCRVAAPVVAPLPPLWNEARAEDGEVYYFHTETMQTTWDRPVK